MGFVDHDHDDLGDYNERVEYKERKNWKSTSCFKRLDRGEAINGGRGQFFLFLLSAFFKSSLSPICFLSKRVLEKKKKFI